MIVNSDFSVYELSINVRVTWQGHSLSNAGNNGSIRLLPRRQLLADGTETDACSGNIAKHYNAMLLAELMEEADIPLCLACAARDGRRAAALIGLEDYKDMTIERVLQGCGLCDTHGLLVTAKNAASDGSTQTRQRLSKHSLLEFSFALALPHQYSETVHLLTRMGDSKDDGQMLLKTPARSGTYAFNLRYKPAGIGMDTDKWAIVLTDQKQRLQRYRATLYSLRDQILSPSGALTSTMLPQLTGLMGVIVIRTHAGRAPIYSALDDSFISYLTALESDTCRVFSFEKIDEFAKHMNDLIQTSYPYLPQIRKI